MSTATIRVRPNTDPALHTRVQVTLDLERPLRSWELVDFMQGLKAWTQRKPRVVFCAEGESGWLSEWAEALEEIFDYAEIKVIERRHGDGGPRDGRA
jgi:hypothetical protein